MRLTLSAGLLLVVGASFLIGCESQSQWSPTVDTYGNSNAQFLTRDTEECRAIARSASGGTTEQAARGAAVGAMIGAAGGAIIGAMFGRPGTGAAIGAATVGVGVGASTAEQTEADFKQAFTNCMRGRGHNVVN